MSDGVRRGVGVEGTLGVDAVADLAALAERCGYGSFWFNVTSPAVDPAATAGAALARTRAIDVAVGLCPLDAHPAEGLARRLAGAAGVAARLLLGVGAGQVRRGALALVEDGVARLRAALPGVRVAVGAYGPNMLRLGGRIADGVILGWMTPERVAWAREQIAGGAGPAGRPVPAVYLYHRAVRGAAAASRIEAEMAAYRRFPVHARHQAAMRRPQAIGVVADEASEVDRALRPYAGSCVPVLKPLPGAREDLAEWRALVRFFAPGGSETDHE